MPNLPVPVLTIGLLIALQPFHDRGLVRPPALQRGADPDRDPDIAGASRCLNTCCRCPPTASAMAPSPPPQLKTIQEVITLLTFAVFSTLYLKEPLGWNHAVGFGFIFLGAWFIFHKWT